MAYSIKLQANFCVSCDKIIKKLVSRNFIEVLNTAETGEYNLDNIELAADYLFTDLVDFITQDSSSPYFYKYTHQDYINILNSYGITGEYLLKYILDEIFPTASNKFKKIFGASIQNTSGKISDKTRAKYETQINNYKKMGGDIKEISYFEAEQFLNDDRYDVYAARDKYGEHECLFYLIDKGADRHWIRSYHAYNTYCSYFNVRELFFKNWLEKPEDQKYATQL